jgi:hypothetical protein
MQGQGGALVRLRDGQDDVMVSVYGCHDGQGENLVRDGRFRAEGGEDAASKTRTSGELSHNIGGVRFLARA